jgi:hypothetical protein
VFGVQEFTEAATEQTAKLIALTRWLVALTAALAVGLVVQVIVALTG